MAFLTSGGSQVTSTNIVDGSILNADINAAAAIALTKLSGLIGNPGTFLSIETTSGATHSLTTLANQRVLVLCKGNYVAGGTAFTTVTLAYNGVTKDIATIDGSSSVNPSPWFCMYTEVPGAATQNITVTVDQSASLTDVKIVVIKLQQSA